MAKLSVIQCVNGTYSVVAETDSLQAAYMELHRVKRVLWNDPGTYHATVKVLDEHLVEYKEPEEITHPEPEPEPEEPEDSES